MRFGAGASIVRFNLTRMLTESPPGYLNELSQLAGSSPRVRLVPPVPFDRIITTISEYDMGVYLLPNVNLNNALALPNKFFEFNQARLALVVGPSLEMARMVKAEGCGVVNRDFRGESLRVTFGRLDATSIDAFKHALHDAATRHCAERNREAFLQVVCKALHAAPP